MESCFRTRAGVGKAGVAEQGRQGGHGVVRAAQSVVVEAESGGCLKAGAWRSVSVLRAERYRKSSNSMAA